MSAVNWMCAGHAAFDQRVADIVARVLRGEWAELDGSWAELADDMADHFEYEEREIFDDYAQETDAQASGAAELRAEHAELRDLLGRIAAEIQRRVVGAPTIELFVTRLQSHSAREEATIYPWLEQRRGTHRRASHTSR